MPARIGARLQAVRAHAWPPPRVVSAREPCARRHARVGPARLGGPLAGPVQAYLPNTCSTYSIRALYR
eukprot:1839261-Prymnesium_polylepis.1